MTWNLILHILLLFRLFQRIKYLAKPATLSLIPHVIQDLTRSRAALVVENALRCQQFIAPDATLSTGKKTISR